MKPPQRCGFPAASIAAPRRARFLKLHLASNGGFGPRAKPLAAVAILTAGLIAAAGGLVDARAPLGLVNTTPSEPIGFYWRTTQAPARGRLIAFPPPAVAAKVGDGHLARLHSFLKAVGAVGGDTVCSDGRVMRVNGAPAGRVAQIDSAGRRLPRWLGCRTLGPGELFVLSNRVPNSFDSRYFGPVAERDVIAVYRPVWVWG